VLEYPVAPVGRLIPASDPFGEQVLSYPPGRSICPVPLQQTRLESVFGQVTGTVETMLLAFRLMRTHLKFNGTARCHDEPCVASLSSITVYHVLPLGGVWFVLLQKPEGIFSCAEHNSQS
jgi:hypothetical protein